MTPLPTILSAVAAEFSVTVADLTGRVRGDNIDRARRTAMYLARTETGASLKVIGRAIGGRSFSTVRDAVVGVQALIESVERIEAIREAMAAGEVDPVPAALPVALTVPRGPRNEDVVRLVAPGTHPAGRFSMLGGTVAR